MSRISHPIIKFKPSITDIHFQVVNDLLTFTSVLAYQEASLLSICSSLPTLSYVDVFQLIWLKSWELQVQEQCGFPWLRCQSWLIK